MSLKIIANLAFAKFTKQNSCNLIFETTLELDTYYCLSTLESFRKNKFNGEPINYIFIPFYLLKLWTYAVY
jgi:hypothetical protein